MFLTLLITFFCCLGGSENTSTLRGETYVVNIPKGWEPGTSEKMAGKPFRRKIAGYDVTTTSRINPDRKVDCSIEISEYIKCKDYSSIQKKDSVRYATSELFASMKWHKGDNVSHQYYVDLIGKPHRHLETGEEMVLRERVWYKAGNDNIYVIRFGTTSIDTWKIWLPKIEKLVATLQEVDKEIRRSEKKEGNGSNDLI